jgi:hypothetical protein
LIKKKEHVLDLGGTEVTGVDFNDDLAGLYIDALLINALALPPESYVNIYYLRRGKDAYLIFMLTTPNALSTYSRTGCVSPVARTKSSA